MKIGPVVLEKILIEIALPVDVENGHSQQAGMPARWDPARAGNACFRRRHSQHAGIPARIQAENWLNVLRSEFSACIV